VHRAWKFAVLLCFYSIISLSLLCTRLLVLFFYSIVSLNFSFLWFCVFVGLTLLRLKASFKVAFFYSIYSLHDSDIFYEPWFCLWYIFIKQKSSYISWKRVRAFGALLTNDSYVNKPWYHSENPGTRYACGVTIMRISHLESLRNLQVAALRRLLCVPLILRNWSSFSWAACLLV